MNNYEFFIQKKIKDTKKYGFIINENDLNNKLFDFQKHIVKTALYNGCYAIFADTGLGKTIMQLEWAVEILSYTKKSVLIVAPLAVSAQTIKEGKKFNITVHRLNTAINNGIGLYITNYEQLKNIKDLDKFSGVVLDESSILKNFTGKYKNEIIKTFSNFKYKLACTATPSPNDLMELGNHSEFLNQMSYHEMLSLYFVHDGGQTSKWRLKNHAKKDFYSWIGTWATIINCPSDLGFEKENKKFLLPNLNFYEKKIISPKKNNGLLFNTSNVNAIDFNKELRITKELRLRKVKEIIDNNINEFIIVWINQNDDADYLKKILKGYDFREVRGSDSIEKKENDLFDFANKRYKILITKSKIAGMGMNFQHCHIQIFASLDFSFEKLYQSIRRSYRFGQTDNVNIYLITTDTMQNVVKIIKEKEKIFITLRQEMQKIINYEKRKFTIMIDKTNDFIKDNVTLLRGDCITRIKEIESETIGFSIFSPPFADLYVYSDRYEDIGNSKNYDEFFKHFEFLIPELHRVMMPGRIIAIHCMDLPIQKGKEGYIGLRDFSGMLINLFQKYNFIYHSRVTIWKDPVIEMQRTKALGLLHKQLKKDSSMSRVGIPDYLLIFRKDGKNEIPIKNDKIPVHIWQKYASPVWHDINYTNTLNKQNAKCDNDEKHICPLQLDTIQRAITLWSNENDIIFSPFAGIGSEIVQALSMNRKAIGIELKDSYFKEMIKNVTNIMEKNKMRLFNAI